jgi:hypothetical protein
MGRWKSPWENRSRRMMEARVMETVHKRFGFGVTERKELSWRDHWVALQNALRIV